MGGRSGILNKLNSENRDYLDRYFAHAPEQLMEKFRVIHIPEGTIFINEGAVADAVYILLQGRVTAVDYRVRATVYGFCRFHPIEMFGTLEIMGGMKRYKTTLAASEDSTLLQISRTVFEPWFLNDGNALRMESRKTVGYLLQQARKERLYVLLSGNERICILLLNMYEAYAKGETWQVYMSRKECAEAAGLSERSVTRALKELEKQGCITRDGWNIIISAGQYAKMKELLQGKMNEMEE